MNGAVGKSLDVSATASTRRSHREVTGRGRRSPQASTGASGEEDNIFGDIASGRIFFTDVDQLVNGKPAPFFELPLVHEGKRQSLLDIVHADRADLRFGLDEAGEIYVLTK